MARNVSIKPIVYNKNSQINNIERVKPATDSLSSIRILFTQNNGLKIDKSHWSEVKQKYLVQATAIKAKHINNKVELNKVAEQIQKTLNNGKLDSKAIEDVITKLKYLEINSEDSNILIISLIVLAKHNNNNNSSATKTNWFGWLGVANKTSSMSSFIDSTGDNQLQETNDFSEIELPVVRAALAFKIAEAHNCSIMYSECAKLVEKTDPKQAIKFFEKAIEIGFTNYKNSFAFDKKKEILSRIFEQIDQVASLYTKQSNLKSTDKKTFVKAMIEQIKTLRKSNFNKVFNRNNKFLESKSLLDQIDEKINELTKSIMISKKELEQHIGFKLGNAQTLQFPLNIKQGQIGDCYLLSALLVMSHTEEGRAKLNDMIFFSETDISCKFTLANNAVAYNQIKANYNLHKAKIEKDGYKLFFEDESATIIVSLDNKKCEEILKNPHGLNSNLFVRLLEQATTKLMLIQKNALDNNLDVTVAYHDNNAIRKRADDKILFNLLGLEASEKFFDSSIELFAYLEDLKKQADKLPCYFGRIFGDDPSRKNYRHAYVLEKIEFIDEGNDKKIKLTVRNPHDSSKLEFKIFKSAQELLEYNPGFTHFAFV